MNRRHRACTALILTLGTMTGVASAQQPTTPPAPAPTSSAPAPVTPSQTAYTNPGGSKSEIDAFVKANVENLVNEADPVAQGRSRENLAQATMTQGAPALPEFLFEYGRSLNAALVAKLDPKVKAGLRARLNIAIVAARVAYIAQNITLQEVAIKLINDPAEPVVLWGIKTAQPMVPQAVKLKVGSAVPPLVDAIRPAVFRHPLGAVFDEAYTALGGTNDPIVVDELMKLWENRLEQYRKGIPEDPDVDGKPVFMLTTSQAWSTVLKDPKTRANVMQMITDQMVMAANYADTSTGEQHDKLVKLVQQCAAGCWVVGGHQKLAAIVTAADAASKINPAALASTTKVTPMITGIVAEITKAFPGVKPPGNVAANVAGNVPANQQQ
jgi:hypothetical protein